MKRTISTALFLTILIGNSILPTACHQGFSHQPSTINQMKLLVTPQDQTVTQALQEALSEPDTSLSGAPSSVITDINKIRLWVYSNIKQASDENLHGVNDYWQTTTETLALKAGDCEDFAILVVSLMRAYGVPQDQLYVAVGTDSNKDWHAIVLERYSYGAWVEFDPEDENDAVLLAGDMPLPYNISYCFNDQDGFNGTPGYPRGYTPPTVSIVPIKPGAELRTITDISTHNASLDAAKRRLGELWLPTYIPEHYAFAIGSISSISDKNYLSLTYQAGAERQLYVTETNTLVFDKGMFQPGTYELTTINNQPAYFGIYTFSIATGSSKTVMSGLIFGFIQGNLNISLDVSLDSLTHEELIRVAESFVEY